MSVVLRRRINWSIHSLVGSDLYTLYCIAWTVWLDRLLGRCSDEAVSVFKMFFQCALLLAMYHLDSFSKGQSPHVRLV